ncbi:serine/threonine-protein kinase haspin homolog [Silene latifolia]|uniref:serine/threonine-protein kinase haspin homolog n=1 Tax=Silene latifolia TaxID=37657 RepID=UPI003D76CB12
MASNPRKTTFDELWSNSTSKNQENQAPNLSNHQQPPKIIVTYRRDTSNDAPPASKNSQQDGSKNSRASTSNNANRVSFVPNRLQRVSWNRSLSTRGRTSIAVIAVSNRQGEQKRGPRRKNRPPIPKGKLAPLPNFEKERAYFQEVDADELLEESPSPKKCVWVMGHQPNDVTVPPLCTRLEKWLHAKRRHEMVSTSLSTILRTPAEQLKPIPYNNDGCDSSCLLKSETFHLRNISDSGSVPDIHTHSEKSHTNPDHLVDKDFDDIESEIKKLSLASRPSSSGNDAFFALLKECGQSAPSTLLDVFSKLCDPGTIVKIGEGTYGEAFIAGDSVCKLVPIDGELRVNGEVQKRSIELLEEVILSRTLNHLRGPELLVDNATSTFIETKDIKVCQGPYDPILLKAWETWDAKNSSENDHPKLFQEQQCYVVSILEHGGKDLEGFVLVDFNEAQSLLVQVTAALAVAEAAFEFEHRDLHWGNILLSRKETPTLQFTLEGKTSSITTHGLVVSIIDFTLSRINTGNTILYLDLSLDPELFEGPKGDKQSETYRKMREVTEDCWDGSVPKTNVLWLQYLVDILILKKSFKRSGKDERELRSLKKRLNSYDSAKEALSDSFFSELILDHAT